MWQNLFRERLNFFSAEGTLESKQAKAAENKLKVEKIQKKAIKKIQAEPKKKKEEETRTS